MSLKRTVRFKWYKHPLILLFLIVYFQENAWITSADFSQVFQNSNQMIVFLSCFIHPNFSYLPKLIEPMVKTPQMSLLGTVIGLILAIPVNFLATTVVTENHLLSTIFRSPLGLVRIVPILLLAALSVVVFGIGKTTGMLTIAVFTSGMMSQLMFQAIEAIDFGPIEAIATAGANKMQIVIWLIAPRVLSQLANYTFYAFEANIHASIVLGYVGADGIDVISNSSLVLLNYERVSIIILTILVTVAIADELSERVRRPLL